MMRAPVVTGAYPVTAVMSAFGVHEIVSVVAVPVAVPVTTVAQAPEVIAPVPSAELPLAIVCVIVAEALGKVIVVLSVPASVIVLLAVNVLPLAIVSVAEVAGAVIATLLTDVAEATPNVGVVNDGLVRPAKPPEGTAVLQSITGPVVLYVHRSVFVSVPPVTCVPPASTTFPLASILSASPLV